MPIHEEIITPEYLTDPFMPQPEKLIRLLVNGIKQALERDSFEDADALALAALQQTFDEGRFSALSSVVTREENKEDPDASPIYCRLCEKRFFVTSAHKHADDCPAAGIVPTDGRQE